MCVCVCVCVCVCLHLSNLFLFSLYFSFFFYLPFLLFLPFYSFSSFSSSSSPFFLSFPLTFPSHPPHHTSQKMKRGNIPPSPHTSYLFLPSLISFPLTHTLSPHIPLTHPSRMRTRNSGTNFTPETDWQHCLT